MLTHILLNRDDGHNVDRNMKGMYIISRMSSSIQFKLVSPKQSTFLVTETMGFSYNAKSKTKPPVPLAT